MHQIALLENGTPFVELEEGDDRSYSKLFSACPELSFNRETYRCLFSCPDVKLRSLVDGEDLVAFLGEQKDYEMEYWDSHDQKTSVKCNYLFSAFADPSLRKRGKITHLLDLTLKLSSEKSFGARLLGDGVSPFSVKPGNKGLIQILESRGFEMIGYKQEHGGRVYLRGDNERPS
ncbi:hypothetical protein CMI48_00135 [Candidatus Pacearchaeota archaeon]|nr:hypothetical protein [Candidatus Pacearchaeota archaeon]|tara:strand:+ start:937 stop:1461 length:525 start_codon:yes stop_codon:yes gene_type:complete